MFSFSAYTTLPFGNYTPFDNEMVCTDFDKNEQEYHQNEYSSTNHGQFIPNTIVANADARVASNSLTEQTGLHSVQSTTYSGGSVELLDFETGEVLRLADKPPSTKSCFDIENASFLETSSDPFVDGTQKEKQIWMPLRDAETGQPLCSNLRRSVAEIAANAVLPVVSQSQSRLSTPGPSGNRSSSVDVDSLLNRFDVNHIDLTALDREVSLAELGSLLNPSSTKGKMGAITYRATPAEAYHYQQPKQPASTAFDMAPAEYFTPSMLDIVDDIMMPSMTNTQQTQQQVSDRRAVSSFVAPNGGSWPAVGGPGSGGNGGVSGSGNGGADDDGSGQRQNGLADAAVFGCAADAGGSKDCGAMNSAYYPTNFTERQQQHSSSANNNNSGDVFGDDLSGWAPSYDFGQESFVLPTTSQAWRYDLSYVGAYSPVPFAGYADLPHDEQQQSNLNEAEMMMPDVDEKFDISTFKPVDSIEALLNSPSVESYYPPYADDAGKANPVIPNTSGGFMMPIKTEAEPVTTMMTPPSNYERRRSSKNKVSSSKQYVAAMPPLSESQLHIARSLEVASFRHGNSHNNESRSSSPSMLSGKVGRSGTSIGSVESGSMNRRILRDRRLVEQHKLPFSYDDIVWMPVDEFFNVLVSPACALTLKQRDLLKDIRRRGKNKVAARNCRRRKVDQIDNLDETVRTMRDKQARADEDLRRVDENLECALQVLAALRRQAALDGVVTTIAGAAPVAGF